MATRPTIQEHFFKQFQESKKKKEKEENEEENTHIELNHGELSNRQQIQQEKICQSNKISYYKDDKYIIIRFLLGLFKQYFYRFGNSVTIVILFVVFATPIIELLESRIQYEVIDYVIIHAGQLLIGLIVLFIRDLYILQIRKELLQMINQSQYTLFQRFQDDKISQLIKNKQDESGQTPLKIQTYTSAEVCDIQIGDIILLKKGDLCPADCLILDMKESFCSVKNTICSGSNQFDIKRPPQVTQILSSSKIKGYHFEYRKILNGRVEFVSSEENQVNFEGFVKLNKDPNGENINDQNIIFRGQEIMYTEWCVALVLYVGYDCRYFQAYKTPMQNALLPQGSINSKIEQFFFLTYLFIIVFTLISSILDFTHPFLEFDQQFQDDKTGRVAGKYMIFLPTIIYPFFDFMQLIQIHRAKKIFENPFHLDVSVEGKDDASQNGEFVEMKLTESTFTPIDEKQQGDICLTTHAIFSKSGTLMHTEEFIISSITIGNKMYKLNLETLTEVMNSQIAKQSMQFVYGDQKVPSHEAIDADEGGVNTTPKGKNNGLTTTKKENLEKMKAIDFELITLKNAFLQTQTQTQMTTNPTHENSNEDFALTQQIKKYKEQRVKGNSLASSQNANSEDKNSPTQKYDDSPFFRMDRLSSRNKSNVSGEFTETDQMQINPQALSELPSAENSPTDIYPKLENLLLRSKNDSLSQSKDMESSNITGGFEKYYKNATQLHSSQTIDGRMDSQTPLDFSSSIHNTSKIGHSSMDKNDFEFIQEEKDFLRDLSKNDQLFAHAIKAIGISHLTKTKYLFSSQQFLSETLNPQDKIIQDFTSQLGFQFRCSNKIMDEGKQKFQYIYTTIQGETQTFTFLIPPAFNERKTRLCVILKEDDSKKYTLYLKEELVNFPSYILVEKGLSRQDQEKKLKRLIELGQIPIAYCKKELDDFEVCQIINQYENAIRVAEYYQNKEQMINYIYSSLLSKLELLCIVGVQELARKDSVELVSLLNESYIKTWMLTGDQFQKAVPAAYSCKILQKDPQCQTIVFDCSNYKSLRSLIKNYILVLKSKYMGSSQQFSMKKNVSDSSNQNSYLRKKTAFINSEEEEKSDIFNIIISGKTFNLIRKDQYLNDHFTFLLNFTKNLVGYQFDQFQKAQIIENLKVCQPHSKVLSIGNSVSDLRMFAKSDYSIEIVDFSKREIFGRSNSVVRNMKDIIKQISINSKGDYLYKEDLVVMNFYRCFFIGILFFFWNTYQSSYGIYLLKIPYLLQAIYYTPVTLFIILLLKYYKWGAIKKKCIIDKVQTLIFIINNQSVKRDSLFSYIKTILFQSLFDGLIVFLIFIYQYQNQFVSDDGKVIEREMLGFFLYMSIHFIFLFKYICNRSFHWKLYIVSLLSLGTIQVNRLWDKQISHSSFTVLNMSNVCSIFLSITLNLISYQFMPFLSKKIKKTSEQFYDFFEIFKILVIDQVPKKVSNNLTRLIRLVFQDRDMERALEELNTDDISISQSKTNKYTLKFLQQDTEKKYITLISTKDRRYLQISLLIQILLQELALALIYSYELKDNENFNTLSTTSAVLMIIWFLTLTSLYKKYFVEINYFILAVRVMNRMNLILTSRFIQNSLEEIINDLIMSQFSYINPIYFGSSVGLTTACYIIVFIAKFQEGEYYTSLNGPKDSFSSTQTNNFIKISVLVFQIGITMLIFRNKYRFDQLQRLHFQKENHLSYETKKIQSILSILMPKFIRDKIDKDGEVQLQEDQGDVSILFCDICDFEQIINSEQENIVRLVDKLFRQFDGFCSHTGLQKIETVGKTYMAAGGLKDAENKKSQFRSINPVARAVIMSFEMMEAVKAYSYGDNQKIKIKIGVHYGRVIAGVIGCHKPQFSLIGDTVNMASRVCSTGDVCQITISEEAYEEIKKVPHINFLKKKVFAKGKGDITTYQITKKSKQKNPTQNEIPLRDQVIQRQSQKKHSEVSPFKNQLVDINTKTIRRNKTAILKQRKFQNDAQTDDNLEYFNTFNFQLINPIKSPQSAKLEKRRYTNKQSPKSYGESQSQIRMFQEEGTTTATAINNDEQNQTTKNTIFFQNNQLNTQNGAVSNYFSQKGSYTVFSKGIFSNGFIQKPLSSKILGQQAIQEMENEEEDKKNESYNQGKQRSPSGNKSKLDDRRFSRKQSETLQESNGLHRMKTTSLNNKITNRTTNSPSIEQQNNFEKSLHGSGEVTNKYIQVEERMKESNQSDMYNGESIPKISKFKHTENNQITEEEIIDKNTQWNFTENSLSPQKVDKSRPKSNDLTTQLEVIQVTENQITDPSGLARKSKRYLSKEFSKLWTQKMDNNQSSTIIIQPILQLEQELDVDLKIDIVQDLKEVEVEIDKLEELYGDDKVLLRKIKQQNEKKEENLLMKIIKVDEQMQKAFRIYQTDININAFRRSLILCTFSCIFKMSSILIVINDFQLVLYSSIVFQAISILLCIIPLFIKNLISDFFGSKLSLYMSTIYYLTLTSILLEIVFMDFEEKQLKANPGLIQVLTLPIVFIYILFMRLSIFTLRSMTLKAILTSFSWLFCSSINYQPTFLLYYLVFFAIYLQLIMSSIHLKLEMSQFKHTQILESRAQKQNDILMYLLPEHILSKFLTNPNKKIELIDHLDNVTFLFADIAGFTKYSGSVQPENVVNMLRILFNEFDQQCQKKNLYKIYTIGDCYVVIGTKNANNRLRPHEEARNVVELGFEMIQIIKKVRSIVQFEELEMRIGVHTGSYIGGVIGTDIVRYDIYGSDVMIANKMESNGEQGKIMVSKTTMNLLQDNYGNDVYIKQFHKNIEGYFIHNDIN